MARHAGPLLLGAQDLGGNIGVAAVVNHQQNANIPANTNLNENDVGENSGVVSNDQQNANIPANINLNENPVQNQENRPAGDQSKRVDTHKRSKSGIFFVIHMHIVTISC